MRHRAVLDGGVSDSKTGAEQAAVANAFRDLAPRILAAVDRGKTPEDNLWQEMKDQLPAFSPGATESVARSRFTPVKLVFFNEYDTQVRASRLTLSTLAAASTARRLCDAGRSW